MDKTVKELAQELGITVQGIHARLNKIDRQTHTYKRENRTYITPEGQALIRDQGAPQTSQEGREDPATVELVEVLKEQVKILKEQLNETNSILKDQLQKKDKQLEDQIALNKSLSVLFAQTQQLLTGRDVTTALSNGLKADEDILKGSLTNEQSQFKSTKAHGWKGFRGLFKKGS